MIGLTKRQRETVAFIRSYRDKHGVAPSCGDIAEGLGIKSRGRAKAILDELIERGALRRSPRRARAIELIEQPPMVVLLNNEIFSLLSAYASGMHISIDTAASELLRQALGAS